MNLTDLTEAARCKDCGGTAEQRHLNPGVNLEGERVVFLTCPRCSDHPGIDPDVVATDIVDYSPHVHINLIPVDTE